MSTKISYPVKEQIDHLESVKNHFRIIKHWYRCGDQPPTTIYKSIYLMMFLMVLGIWLLSLLIKGHFKTDSENKFPFIPVAVFSAVTLVPGFWILWISVCCWRRVDGYDWWMIPHF